jgi:hypothetical protein
MVAKASLAVVGTTARIRAYGILGRVRFAPDASGHGTGAGAAILAAAVVLSACSGVPTDADSPTRRPVSATPSADVAIASVRGVRDVGPLVGFRDVTSSWWVGTLDVDRDGWRDVLIVHHGLHAAQLFRNVHDDGASLGFEEAFTFRDEIHDRKDRHACDVADVDLDGDDDVLCLKGAEQGSVRKWNELWIQVRPGHFEDRAHAWGIQDVWGRGRRPVFLDLNHDPYPDVFVGNDYPRHDGHPTPSRTFVNVAGRRFREVDLGLTQRTGANCAFTADFDRNGWDDLLLCGKRDLKLYLRRPAGFHDAKRQYNVEGGVATAALLRDLDGDGRDDLVIVRRRMLTVQLRLRDDTFSEPVTSLRLGFGHGVAVGDIDGRRGPDILVVQGCVEDVNLRDLLLLNAGSGTGWERVPLMAGVGGCGDTATDLDFDRDGMDDFVVLNGGGFWGPLYLDGPDQLLTMGDWRPPG